MRDIHQGRPKTSVTSLRPRPLDIPKPRHVVHVLSVVCSIEVLESESAYKGIVAF